MKECLTEEILQQYFDGELEGERMESTALHLAGCEACTASLLQLEVECNLLCAALAPEFDVVVPTERLQRRIEAAIAGLQLVSPARSRTSISPLRNWLESLSALITLSPQRTLGYASLVAVLAFAAIFGITRWRSADPGIPSDQAIAHNVGTAVPPPVVTPPSPVDLAAARKTSLAPSTVQRTKPSRKPSTSPRLTDQGVAEVKLLPGERSYLKTIAALDTTIKSGNKTMRPALQAEYERNLALVDRAIAATRTAAKRNPNDPDAADFMFSAYQSKVDLLNTIADARVYNRQR